jgi:hypothetical protein
MHTGECELIGADVGDTMHIASRISALAGPGEVLVSDMVRERSWAAHFDSRTEAFTNSTASPADGRSLPSLEAGPRPPMLPQVSPTREPGSAGFRRFLSPPGGLVSHRSLGDNPIAPRLGPRRKEGGLADTQNCSDAYLCYAQPGGVDRATAPFERWTLACITLEMGPKRSRARQLRKGIVRRTSCVLVADVESDPVMPQDGLGAAYRECH